MKNIEFQVENERLLSKLRANGIEARSFSDWKDQGRCVIQGETAKSFSVQSGNRKRENPITGEATWSEPIFKTAYGFLANQTN